jgi:golgi-specific brefeldin A-resistance guanine nucleotide exchange factor 1
MPLDALKAFMTALLDTIPEDSSPRVMVVKPDLPPSSPVKSNGSKVARSKRPAYDPALLFVLELATILTLRDNETVEEFGKDVADALQTVIRDATNIHPLVISRTVYYLLMLLRASNDFDFVRAPVVLHTFSSFDADLLKQCAQSLLNGMRLCINGPAGLRNEMASSPDFWAILAELLQIEEATAGTFSIVEDLVDAKSGISADNYEAVIKILNEFATAARIGARDEQMRDQVTRSRRQVNVKRAE